MNTDARLPFQRMFVCSQPVFQIVDGTGKRTSHYDAYLEVANALYAGSSSFAKPQNLGDGHSLLVECTPQPPPPPPIQPTAPVSFPSTMGAPRSARYAAPRQADVDEFASVDEWAELYRWRIRRAHALMLLVIGGPLMGGATPLERLHAAMALCTPDAATYYRFTGLWKPAKIGLAYLMFFSVFEQLFDSSCAPAARTAAADVASYCHKSEDAGVCTRS